MWRENMGIWNENIQNKGLENKKNKISLQVMKENHWKSG